MSADTETWRTDTLEGLGKGSRVWFRAGPRSWELGTLQSLAGTECSLALDSSLGEGTGRVIDCNTLDVLPANPALLEEVPDLTSLSFLNEPSILHTLRQRYSGDTIYTHAGPVLIAINPFKRVDLYTPEHVQHYVNRPAAGQGSQGYEPHIFLTADKAFKQVGRISHCGIDMPQRDVILQLFVVVPGHIARCLKPPPLALPTDGRHRRFPEHFDHRRERCRQDRDYQVCDEVPSWPRWWHGDGRPGA